MEESKELKYKDGTIAKRGDVIRWRTWDNDDYTTWTFTGIFNGRNVIYLGGGVDFGLGIGKQKTIQEVIDESENNDCSEQCGVEKVGLAPDLVRRIRAFEG